MGLDPIDLEAEREGVALTVISWTYDPLRGNCAHATWPRGSSEADGDNPWLELAERKMEDNT